MSKAKSKKKPKSGSKLPKRIYVWDEGGANLYYDDVDGFGNGTVLDVYERVGAVKLVVETKVEPVE